MEYLGNIDKFKGIRKGFLEVMVFIWDEVWIYIGGKEVERIIGVIYVIFW